jgi:2-dehydropantoate 2-reductase
MQILVVGAGAVGGYFGGRLAEANRDVTFLVRVRRAEEIKEKGLQIVSPHGDLTLHPKAVTADQIKGLYDMILLGVKSYALESAVNDFASAVGPDTMILPVLNGMRHMDQLAALRRARRSRWRLHCRDGNRPGRPHPPACRCPEPDLWRAGRQEHAARA